jgi:putative tryptophan/tyrosine transport system substrate-binding protein
VVDFRTGPKPLPRAGEKLTAIRPPTATIAWDARDSVVVCFPFGFERLLPTIHMLSGDPVELGIVATLGQPGGNATGINFFAFELGAKRPELLHELVPKATVIALLVNPDAPRAESSARQTQEAARSLGQQMHVLRARTERDIDAAFATLVQLRADALLVASDPFFNVRREQIVGLAARHACRRP